MVTGDRWIGLEAKSIFYQINAMIGSARENLLIVSYTFSSEEIINAVSDAMRRGVNVDIYINQETENTDSQRIKKGIERLDGKGSVFKIHKINCGTLHTKIITADERFILIGSANPTFSGMFKNYEIAVYFENPEIARKIRKMMWRLEEP